MKTSCTLAALLLCTACLVDREIGTSGQAEVMDPGGAPQGHPPTLLAPPPTLALPKSCCTVTVGPLMALDDEIGASGENRPSVAWLGTAWAVSWQTGIVEANARHPFVSFPVFRLVQRDTPGALFRLEQERHTIPVAIGYDADLAPGGGYALALASSPYDFFADPQMGRVVTVDRAGGRLGSFDLGPTTTAAMAPVGRMGDRVVFTSGPGTVDHVHRLILLDRALKPLAPPVEIGTSLFDPLHGVDVLSVDDQVITVWFFANRIEIRTFVGRTLSEPYPAIVLEERTTEGLHLDRVGSLSGMSAARVGDTVVIAAKDASSTRTWTYRPSTRSLTEGPSVVGPGAPYSSIRIAGDSQGTSAGLCFPVGRELEHDDPVELKFALVGPDGKPGGQPVTIASDLRQAVFCEVAAGRPGEYIVVFWHLSRAGDPRTRVMAARVEVQGLSPTIE